MAVQARELLAADGIPDPRGLSDEAVTTRVASVLKAAELTGSAWPYRRAMGLPLAASQTRAVLSSEAVTTRVASVLKAAE